MEFKGPALPEVHLGSLASHTSAASASLCLLGDLTESLHTILLTADTYRKRHVYDLKGRVN